MEKTVYEELNRQLKLAKKLGQKHRTFKYDNKYFRLYYVERKKRWEAVCLYPYLLADDHTTV